jgi:DNA-binding NtrC family response regulator
VSGIALRFAMRVVNELGKKIEGFSPDALRALQERMWRGNVRQLRV